MSWALSLPVQTLKDSSARHVLLCLANYAGSNGAGAFPSAKTLTDDTGLSERTIRIKLDLLEEVGLIVRGNQALAAVYIDRHDRRPVVYDLMIKRGAVAAPREDASGCSLGQNGVQPTTERGAATAPNTSINHQLTEKQQQREISEVVAGQDRQALEPQDDRQRFAMFAEFVPSANALEAQLKIAGLPEDCATEDMIARFKGFFVAKTSVVDSAAGWCFKLAGWIKRERALGSTSTEDDAPSGDWASKGVRL
ncbi:MULTISPECIES: helix-turn-helix domain-containing protein [unclassified Pseudomonas]|uniref:helix-turn-helix domain-containing protein n=1 Tax=unclassified Pseudomonas TaxID=196821 RepID=UPI0015A3F940|nr:MULTISPECIES: helix-turn-helix domain-containing protein [unclassified Pseudomonas]NVZ50254.1 helix-turn-helix domain-containing protein [Pseudomonas sp. B6002]NWE18054.1 helix-turn-helix domain-containing protein [Pseudomonas sp. P7548]